MSGTGELHSAALNSAADISAPPRGSEGALGPYLRAIRAHRTLVTIVTLAAIVAAVLWIVLRSATYEATANLLINPLSQEDETFLGLSLLRDSGDPTRTAQTAATLVRSSGAADRTARALGGDWTTKKVLDSISVTPEGESNILAITAKADGAAEATRLADTFARSAIEVRRDNLSRELQPELARLEARLESLADGTDAQATTTERIAELEAVRDGGDPTISQSQRAQRPDSPTGLPAPAIVLLAALAGFTLGSGAALLLELTERRIRNEEEAVALYPLPVLARIPLLKASQLRGRQGTGWHMLPAVREAFRTLMIQLGPHPEGRAHVIMVTSASTGDGKTTSAVNLAAAAAASGDPVILLDFDLRKPDVGRTLGVQAGTELTGLLQPGTQLRDLLSPAPGLPALSVLTTSVAEGDVALVEALSRRLPELIADARELCNYVVLDTAPIGEISDALRLVSDVDNIVVVTRPGNTNRANFEMMRDLLERTAYTPAGFLVIGDSTPRTSAYYAYGATSRELFLPAAEDTPRREEGRSSTRRIKASGGDKGPGDQASPPGDGTSGARGPERAGGSSRPGSRRGRPERSGNGGDRDRDRGAQAAPAGRTSENGPPRGEGTPRRDPSPAGQRAPDSGGPGRSQAGSAPRTVSASEARSAETKTSDTPGRAPDGAGPGASSPAKGEQSRPPDTGKGERGGQGQQGQRGGQGQQQRH